jgi:hypothetical protein
VCSYSGVKIIRHITAGNQRKVLGPFERGAFAIGKEWCFTPRTESVYALFRLAVRPGVLRMHIDTERTTVDL